MKLGFEAEFVTNAEALARRLHREGYSGSESIHHYHCRCEDCEYGTGSPLFRVQSDSTCDGEVISNILTSRAGLNEACLALQKAAVDADAEPGLAAGFHVHSTTRRIVNNPQAFWTIARWEPALLALSGGRWHSNRRNNDSLHESVVVGSGCAPGTDVPSELRERAYRHHQSADRHNNLNINTRYDTWEFRLWNSTRSAWRMELFCLLGDAFTDQPFLDLAGRVESPSTTELDLALQAVGRYYEAELVQRQLAYLGGAVHTAGQVLTLV